MVLWGQPGCPIALHSNRLSSFISTLLKVYRELATTDAERLAVLRALVQRQNEQILRLQRVMDERRHAIPLSVRPRNDNREHVSKSIKHLYQNLAIHK